MVTKTNRPHETGGNGATLASDPNAATEAVQTTTRQGESITESNRRQAEAKIQ